MRNEIQLIAGVFAVGATSLLHYVLEKQFFKAIEAEIPELQFVPREDWEKCLNKYFPHLGKWAAYCITIPIVLVILVVAEWLNWKTSNVEILLLAFFAASGGTLITLARQFYLLHGESQSTRRKLRAELVRQGNPLCLNCGYDLRGQLQQESRCPECGLAFAPVLLRMPTFKQVLQEGKQIEDWHAYAVYYVSRLDGPDGEDAYHSLLEADSKVVPHLIEAYQGCGSDTLRAQLIEIISSFRQPETVVFLGEALRSDYGDTWKSALDGLVAVGTEQARQALLAARESIKQGARSNDSDKLEWIEEALEDFSKGTEFESQSPS